MLTGRTHPPPGNEKHIATQLRTSIAALPRRSRPATEFPTAPQLNAAPINLPCGNQSKRQ
jgi:hypothetical protein